MNHEIVAYKRVLLVLDLRYEKNKNKIFTKETTLARVVATDSVGFCLYSLFLLRVLLCFLCIKVVRTSRVIRTLGRCHFL